jgi:3-dehydroquinate synthase
VIRRCCAIKAGIVTNDEKETASSGGRALLNLGHTFAHAIENVAGYGAYLHGEAVAIGLVLATRLSVELGQLRTETIARVEWLLSAYQLPTHLQNPLPQDQLMAAMQRDKKNRAGKLRFVTMTALGEAITSEAVAHKLVEEVWVEATKKTYL